MRHGHGVVVATVLSSSPSPPLTLNSALAFVAVTAALWLLTSRSSRSLHPCSMARGDSFTRSFCVETRLNSCSAMMSHALAHSASRSRMRPSTSLRSRVCDGGETTRRCQSSLGAWWSHTPTPAPPSPLSHRHRHGHSSSAQLILRAHSHARAQWRASLRCGRRKPPLTLTRASARRVAAALSAASSDIQPRRAAVSRSHSSCLRA